MCCLITVINQLCNICDRRWWFDRCLTPDTERKVSSNWNHFKNFVSTKQLRNWTIQNSKIIRVQFEMEISRKLCWWVSISLCAFGVLLALFANGSYAITQHSNQCRDICVPEKNSQKTSVYFSRPEQTTQFELGRFYWN